MKIHLGALFAILLKIQNYEPEIDQNSIDVGSALYHWLCRKEIRRKASQKITGKSSCESIRKPPDQVVFLLANHSLLI